MNKPEPPALAPASAGARRMGWRVAALLGALLTSALLAAAGPGALTVVLPAWLVGLALRYDNHTGSLTFLAVSVLIVMLVMLLLIAGLSLAR